MKIHPNKMDHKAKLLFERVSYLHKYPHHPHCIDRKIFYIAC